MQGSEQENPLPCNIKAVYKEYLHKELSTSNEEGHTAYQHTAINEEQSMTAQCRTGWNMKDSKQAQSYPETTTPLASGFFVPSAAFHTASDPL